MVNDKDTSSASLRDYSDLAGGSSPTEHPITSAILYDLANAAQWHSRQALDFYTSVDEHELRHAAISVGASSELILKLAIGQVSIPLLADKGDVESLLMIAGHPAGKHSATRGFRSIAAQPALKLAKVLYPSIPMPSGPFPPFEARNASAHFGATDPDLLSAAINSHVALTEKLLAALSVNRESFWGADFIPVVDLVSAHNTSSAKHSFDTKVLVANRRFLAWFSKVPPALHDSIRAQGTSSTSMFSDSHDFEDSYPECPACGSKGHMIHRVERGDVENEEGWFFVERTAEPEFFECSVCDLELEADEVGFVPGAYDYFPEPDEATEEELHDAFYDEDVDRNR